jgi:hypothetical protein
MFSDANARYGSKLSAPWAMTVDLASFTVRVSRKAG